MTRGVATFKDKGLFDSFLTRLLGSVDSSLEPSDTLGLADLARSPSTL